jgi:sugar phosphate isomerase/epimerase
MDATTKYSRRDFGKLALAGLPASALIAGWQPGGAQTNTSRIKGIQVGAITYSFNRLPGGPEAIIQAYRTIGLAEMELMSNHAETLAGAPMAAQGGGRRGSLTPEQQAAQTAAQKARQDWRNAATEATFTPVRDQITRAGIDLRLLCFNINSQATDETIEYGFNMAKWLGVKGMTTSTQVSMARRLAPFAERHKMIVGFHGHDSVDQPDEVHNEASFEAVMAASTYFCANLDVGHYTAAGGDAVDFIKKHHARISNLHFKDMKRNQPNSYVPFGSGDAPLKEVLLLVSKEKYDFPVNIEFEYQGDPLVEVPKCFQYIKDALK